MRFINTIFILQIILMLSSCVTQPPAPIENGSSNISHKSGSRESDYDAVIEEKGKVREFWGEKEVTEEVKEEEEKKDSIVIDPRADITTPKRTTDISHEVIEGETLDSIAKKYDVSKEAIIAKNNLEPPYKLEELQILKIPPQNETVVEIEDIIREKPASPAPVIDHVDQGIASSRHMPVEGKIISKFGENQNQGVNIAAPMGADIHAIAEGVVMHSGFDAKFGNLIIIKSNDGDIFTAYAHMGDLSLKNGETITAGQVIGHVGQTGKVTSPQLHFAVRQGKVPIDPIAYLEK